MSNHYPQRRKKTQVKQVVKQGKLVLDWRKKQQAKATVQVAIEEGLNALPDVYSNVLFQEKCAAVYQHIYENYTSASQSIYQRAA